METTPNFLPKFSKINAAEVMPRFRELLARSRARVLRILEEKTPTFENTVLPMEEIDGEMKRFLSPVGHLANVAFTKEMATARDEVVKEMIAFNSENTQNPRLYKAYKNVETTESAALSLEQKKVIELTLREFVLGGIELSTEDQMRLLAVNQELQKLSSAFEENNLKATEAYKKHVTDPALLAGMPKTAIEAAAKRAEKEGKTGFLLTLDAPSYSAVMGYSENRELRREIYKAYTTRASELGNPEFDNSPIMERILALRHEKARLLGFSSYAELSLARKMAKTPGDVLDFLDSLLFDARLPAEQEVKELRRFAGERGVEDFERWDQEYYSRLLFEERFNLQEEGIRKYFPVSSVLNGFFSLVKELWGVKFREAKEGEIDLWHPDVRFFWMYDKEDNLSGGIYIDLFARPGQKRDGAWMDECTFRTVIDGKPQIPVGYLNCNFTPPVNGVSTLKWREIEILFHEFGHNLHHLLTEATHTSVSGIAGVPWDGVELPSQFMENFLRDRKVAQSASSHVDTGEMIPLEMLDRIYGSKNFGTGLITARQLEFAYFDFKLHLEYNEANPHPILEVLRDVRDAVTPLPYPEWNRFPQSFTHIFVSGYAAGYYSYKWAEMLSSDAWAAFEEKGTFDPETAARFKKEILETGGARGMLENFIAFRGREPSIDALLRHTGLSQE